jgi:hypothetical protein
MIIKTDSSFDAGDHQGRGESDSYKQHDYNNLHVKSGCPKRDRNNGTADAKA